jgi:hypothetical protein
MTRHYLRFETLSLFSAIPGGASTLDALYVLCRAKELETSVTLRRQEKKVGPCAGSWTAAGSAGGRVAAGCFC